MLFPHRGSGAETQTQSSLKLLQVQTETLYNKGNYVFAKVKQIYFLEKYCDLVLPVRTLCTYDLHL